MLLDKTSKTAILKVTKVIGLQAKIIMVTNQTQVFITQIQSTNLLKKTLMQNKMKTMLQHLFQKITNNYLSLTTKQQNLQFHLPLHQILHQQKMHHTA